MLVQQRGVIPGGLRQHEVQIDVRCPRRVGNLDVDDLVPGCSERVAGARDRVARTGFERSKKNGFGTPNTNRSVVSTDHPPAMPFSA